MFVHGMGQVNDQGQQKHNFDEFAQYLFKQVC